MTNIWVNLSGRSSKYFRKYLTNKSVTNTHHIQIASTGVLNTTNLSSLLVIFRVTCNHDLVSSVSVQMNIEISHILISNQCLFPVLNRSVVFMFHHKKEICNRWSIHMQIGILFILAVMSPALFVPITHAQDLQPVEKDEKRYLNMDSFLEKIYRDEIAQNPTATSNTQGQENKRIQIIIVMVSEDAPIPQGLGIEVEITHNELVQATVPIRNLGAIAADENVKLIKMPARATPTMAETTSDSTEKAITTDYIFLIPIVGGLALVGTLAYKRATRK